MVRRTKARSYTIILAAVAVCVVFVVIGSLLEVQGFRKRGKAESFSDIPVFSASLGAIDNTAPIMYVWIRNLRTHEIRFRTQVTMSAFQDALDSNPAWKRDEGVNIPLLDTVVQELDPDLCHRWSNSCAYAYAEGHVQIELGYDPELGTVWGNAFGQRMYSGGASPVLGPLFEAAIPTLLFILVCNELLLRYSYYRMLRSRCPEESPLYWPWLISLNKWRMRAWIRKDFADSRYVDELPYADRQISMLAGFGGREDLELLWHRAETGFPLNPALGDPNARLSSRQKARCRDLVTCIAAFHDVRTGKGLLQFEEEFLQRKVAPDVRAAFEGLRKGWQHD